MKLLIAEKWQKSDTKLLENSSTAVLCWPQRKGDSTMTLGEKIASARKEKGMTQEMLVYLLVGIGAFMGAFLLDELISRIPILRWCVLGVGKEKKRV